jgi:hypothetical protein
MVAVTAAEDVSSSIRQNRTGLPQAARRVPYSQLCRNSRVKFKEAILETYGWHCPASRRKELMV